MTRTVRNFPVLAAGAVAALLATTPAFAQDDKQDSYPVVHDNDSYPVVQDNESYPVVQDNERVIVTAPRTFRDTGEHGGAIRNVSVTGAVRFDDIDLSTPWGKEELRQRVRVMATNLCAELDRRYPVAIKVDGAPSCYEQALDGAMRHANEVIADPHYDYWRP